jgi:hypothetical protein
MFEKASRLKIRYTTSRGAISVEDLWDVPLIDTSGDFSLDNIAKRLNRKLKTDEEESFVVKNSKNETLELAFNIVKHVIKTKLTEAEETKKKVENRKRNEKILDIIERKQDADLEKQDVDTLKGMIQE